MELRIVLRGALAGFCAGVLGFVFARIFAEPYIQKAIDYENGRDDAIRAVNKAAGVTTDPDGPEIFSRTIQSNVGMATGIIAFATAMGALVAVVYLVTHGRFNIWPRTLALVVTGLGFLGVYLVPFVKYPANPPAIGHTFTIGRRTELYLAMVISSIILIILAVLVARHFRPGFGVFNATLIAAACFIVAISIVMGILPPLGHLALNKAQEHTIGYGASFTETPLPVRDFQGHIVYPGFPAETLWKFRFYSVINQLIIWTTIGLIFSSLVSGFLGFKPPADSDSPADDRIPVRV